MDVQVTEYIAALEVNTGGTALVHLYNTAPDHQLHKKITLENNTSYRIHLCHNYLYVTIFSFVDKIDNISKCSYDGEKICQFGKPGNRPGEVDRPKICLSDNKQCLLIADYCNHRLQVLDDGRDTWSVINLPGFTVEMYPLDVLFNTESDMVVLYWDRQAFKYAIRVYKVTK
jgi:hypothetical protein